MNAIEIKERGNIDSSIQYIFKYKIPKNARILDIGCNYGSLLNKLHELGYSEVQGVDVNKSSIDLGRKKYTTLKDKIDYYNGVHLPFEENSFDIVLMFDVIEHIPSIERFLANEVYRVLKKNGKYIFQTPNKYINIPWEIIHKRSLTAYKKYHCSLQSVNSLKKILEGAKFKNIVIEKHNIITDHNKDKVKKAVGFIGLPLLHILQKVPLKFTSNLWGSCEK